MKNIAVIPPNSLYNDNKLFKFDSKEIDDFNKENTCKPFLALQKKLESTGRRLLTIDKYQPEEVDCIVSIKLASNIYKLLRTIKKNPKVKVLHIHYEPFLINPINTLKFFDTSLFDFVLSWNDNYVKKDHIKKYYFLNSKKKFNDKDFGARQGFLCLINSNKSCSKEGELYSERKRAIEYFGSQGLLDLYGSGWESLSCECSQDTYKGFSESKLATLADYKFSVIFENTCNEPGYISEKILDSFSAGCVPIYYGAPNIEEYIPPDCFIDFREFDSYQGLDNYLNSINKEEYNQFQQNIKRFLNSKKYEKFTEEGFSKKCMNLLRKLETKNCQKSLWKIKKELVTSIPWNLSFASNHKKLILALLGIW